MGNGIRDKNAADLGHCFFYFEAQRMPLLPGIDFVLFITLQAKGIWLDCCQFQLSIWSARICQLQQILYQAAHPYRGALRYVIYAGNFQGSGNVLFQRIPPSADRCQMISPILEKPAILKATPQP